MHETPIDVSKRINFIDSLLGWCATTGLAKTTNGGISYIGQINTEVPGKYILTQNYPNPFNPQTTIEFSLVKPSYAELKVYDVLGKELSVFQSEELLNAGTHRFIFNGAELSSGIYFYKLIIKSSREEIVFQNTKKMILIK